MGEWLTMRFYKGVPAATFRQGMEQAVRSLGGSIKWGLASEGKNDLRVHLGKSLQSLYLHPYADSDDLFCKELGRILAVPWIEVRIQDGDLWDYTLFQGSEMADNFGPWPEYWEDPEEPLFAQWKARLVGHPEVLARQWDIPIEEIERYVRQWNPIDDPEDEYSFRFELEGKAYPTDQYEYGDCDQFYDFIRALGGQEPFVDYEYSTIVLPSCRNTQG